MSQTTETGIQNPVQQPQRFNTSVGVRDAGLNPDHYHHPVQVGAEDPGLQHHNFHHTLSSSAIRIVQHHKGPSMAEDDPNFKSDIDRANIFSRIHFLYVFKVIKRAIKLRHEEIGLKDPDLNTFPYRNRSDVLEAEFLKNIKKQKAKNPNKKTNLAWAIIWCTKWDILRCIIIAVIFTFDRVFQGWVLRKLIDSYTYDSVEWKYKWSAILTGCLIAGFYLEHHYNHIGTYFPSHIRGALVSMIYSKVNKFSLYTLTKLSPGQIINLASNDVNVFDEFGVYFPKLIVAPVVLVSCGVILWTYFGVLCLVGLGYVAMWFPLQALYIVKSEEKAQKRNQKADERVNLTSESIEGIRLLKMYTWELRFRDRIFDLRNREVSLEKHIILGESIWRGVSFSSLGIATFLIFMPYFLTHDYSDLTAGKVFSTYYLFAFIRLYGAFFVNQGIVFLIAAHAVIKKIETIMDTPEIGEITFEEPRDPSNTIEFENFTGYWSRTKEEDRSGPEAHLEHKDMGPANDKKAYEAPILPTIIDVSVKIKKNSLNALVGPVGSGKTSFLLALTGEMPKTEGSLRYKGNFAYVEQEPTIFAGTFRESICFGKPYEEKFYNQVIKACNLETDLTLFPNGDLSAIGERGNNLSGGQKARLALARGVYANADIYLLDDPLSAVDPKVASSLFDNCINGILKGKTVILVTHQIDFAKKCEHIIMMKRGRVLESGPFENMKDKDIERPISTIRKKSSKYDEPKLPKTIRLDSFLHRHSSDHQANINTHLKPEKPKQVVEVALKHEQNKPAEIEDKKEPDAYPGKVSARTYLELLRGMGGPFYLLLLLAVYVSVELNNIAYGRLLGVWINNDFAYWKSLTILACLVGLYIVLYFVKYIMLNVALVRSSKIHHERMLNRIVQAPVLFFDTNPIGQILNRFSNDIGTLDRFLPLITMDVFDNILFILSVIVTTAVFDPIHLGPFAVEVVFIYFMLRFCNQAVKQTKKYELRTKGPLFSLFSASLSGLVVIRGFNQMEIFKEKFKNQLHTSIKGAVGFALTARFLAFYVDMGYNIAEIGIIFIMAGRGTLGNQPYLGFSLALVLSVSGVLQYTLRQICMANILFESAARVQSYWDVPNEAPLALPIDKELQAQKWPPKGDIDFHRVYMRYTPTGPHVIKDLTFHAKAAERIGCVGRTGAGKTSILQLLFRLQEVDKQEQSEGCIKIDGVDIATVGLHELRGNISIIPQSPFILTGTVRYNVDPVGRATDEEIWKALKDVHLKKKVESLPHQLDTLMTAATSVFSVGQKQLVCLARSILKPSPIMIMDEATANMDRDTDNYVTTKIKEIFNRATTFTIAHRLLTIANYDKVLVLDKGQIKEFDEPYKLLVRHIGDDSITNDEGHFASMVKNTGPIASQDIFQIAKKAYTDKRNGVISAQVSAANSPVSKTPYGGPANALTNGPTDSPYVTAHGEQSYQPQNGIRNHQVFEVPYIGQTLNTDANLLDNYHHDEHAQYDVPTEPMKNKIFLKG